MSPAAGAPASGAGRAIHAVLATVQYDQSHLRRLRELFPDARFIHADPAAADVIEEALRYVDVAVLRGDLDARFLAAANLRWVHCDHSGLNGSALPEVFERNLIVTGSAGRAAPALAHHAMFFALSLVYGGEALFDARRRHAWRDIPGYRGLRGVYGTTMGIIGLGHTGRELADLARAFGMRVLVYTRRDAEPPASVERLYAAERGEGPEVLLADSDFVVLTVRLTDETHHLIGERELRLMKPSARLINIARGGVVDTAALVQALREGTIAGAGLDVFEQEPLPPEAAIWDAPNVVLTPHTTAEMPDLAGRSIDIIAENVARYRTGRPMLNQLTPADIYTRNRHATAG